VICQIFPISLVMDLILVMFNLFLMKKIFLLLSIVFSLFLFEIDGVVAAGGEYRPGQTFHHFYTLTNRGDCDVIITKIQKSWNSENNAVRQVSYNPRGDTMAGASGSVSYDLSYTLPPGRSVETTINFFTNPSVRRDKVSSSLQWWYEETDCPCDNETTGSWTTTIAPVDDGGHGFCGNGTIETGETCDDNNTISGDGCSATCQTEGTHGSCGNGTIEAGEDCDDNNTISGDGCSATCQTETFPSGPVCGNGTIETGETCDDNNTISGDGCSDTCQNEGGSNPGGGGGSGGSGGGSSSESNGNTGGKSSISRVVPKSLSTCSFITAGNHLCIMPQSDLGIPSLSWVEEDGRNVVKVALDPSSNSDCLDVDQLCVQVRQNTIVGGYRNPTSNFGWTDCLPLSSQGIGSFYKFSGKSVSLPIQQKFTYETRAGLRDFEEVFDEKTGDLIATNYFDYPRAGSVGGDICYFETRPPQIDTDGAVSRTVGEDVYNEARTMMNPNIERILQPCEDHYRCDATGNGALVRSLDRGELYRRPDGVWEPIDLCYASEEENVICFDPSGGSVTLEAKPGNDDFILPDYPVTIVSKGADFRIKDNLVYPDSDEASFGLISLFNLVNGTDYSGHVYIHPDVTNLVGAYYVEGSVLPADHSWRLPQSPATPARNIPGAWFSTLRNQLFWQGTVISRNTILQAGDPAWPRYDEPLCLSTDRLGISSANCPGYYFDATSNSGLVGGWKDNAIEQDLAYLREYFQCLNPRELTNYSGYNFGGSCTFGDEWVADGQAAVDAPSDAPVVIRYDNRIQGNPPPGFETLGRYLQYEIGL